MYDNIKTAFDNLIQNSEFQELVQEYRFRFGIPEHGFNETSSDLYKNWIREGLRKTDYLKDQFIFIAKRCRNLIPDKDPIPHVFLAYYFLFGKFPDKNAYQNDYSFAINPSGILGSFDITFTVPILFSLDKFLEEVEKNEDEITKTVDHTRLIISTTSKPISVNTSNLDPKQDLLATTPTNGSGLVDKVHRDIVYLTEFGRVVLREHLQGMKEEDFTISSYDDKNKPIFAPIQQMGMFLFNRGLYPIAEEYWKHIDDEIQIFNRDNGKRLNRGMSLANTGVSQIVQGKVVEGLFNIYRGYEDDRICLQHLPNILIDPEKDMANSRLFTQFEERQTSLLYTLTVSKYKHLFQASLTRKDLLSFILSLNSDKKLLFYITLYRFTFALDLNNQLTTVISRSEILRSLSELALWFEDELKRKDKSLYGCTLINILDNKVGRLNPTRGQYTDATNLSELKTKIDSAIAVSGGLEITNARIMGCLRNFAGHNIDVQDHIFFKTCDEIFARMISFIIYSRDQGWI